MHESDGSALAAKLAALAGESPKEVVVDGVATLPPVSSFSFDKILLLAKDGDTFARIMGLPGYLTSNQVELLRETYLRAQGLPTEEGACDRLVANLCHAFDELEADFARHYRLDLRELVRTFQWRRVHNLASTLPSNSVYRQKLLSDPEYFKNMEDGGAGGREVTLPVSEFDSRTVMLSHTIGAINLLTSLVYGGFGGKGEAPQYQVPQPATARKLARWQASKKGYDSMVVDLYGEAKAREFGVEIRQ